MPIPVSYFYSIQTVDEAGAKRTVQAGPYQLSAYDFSAVNQCALCWAAPGTQMKYAKKEVDQRGYPTGVVTEATYNVPAPNGEWMTLPVNRLKP